MHSLIALNEDGSILILFSHPKKIGAQLQKLIEISIFPIGVTRGCVGKWPISEIHKMQTVQTAPRVDDQRLVPADHEAFKLSLYRNTK